MATRTDIEGGTGTTPGALEPAPSGPGINVTSLLEQDFGFSTDADRVPSNGVTYDDKDPEYSETGTGWSDVLTGGAAEILSDWTLGTTHAASAGNNRIGIVVASLEDTDPTASIVTWGGRNVTTVYNQIQGTTLKDALIVAYLRESEIAQMSGGAIVTSGATIDSIASAFYEGVNQSTFFPSSCNKKESNVDPTISCSGNISITGIDAAFIAATANTAVNISTLTAGFTEKIDNAANNQTLAIAHRSAIGAADLLPSVTWDGSTGRKLIFSAAIGGAGIVGDAFNDAARQHASGAGSNTGIFAGTQLPESMSLLRVYGWWPTVAGAATDTDFAITGKYTQTVTGVDQSANQGQWNLLHTFGSSSSGTTLTVTIDDDANGIVLADAIKLEWEELTQGGSIEFGATHSLVMVADTVGSESRGYLKSSVLFLT